MKSIVSVLAGSVLAKRHGDPLASDKNVLYHESDSSWQQGLFETQLDNFDASSQSTFNLRYWANNDFWDQDDGPIFLYLCGEWTCSPPSVTQAAFALGQKVNAKLLVLEHRYYGDSQPFDDWSYEHLKWLNTEQALADIAAFIDSQNQQMGRKRDWLVIGGSYPGALSAWFKSLYPSHAKAAWSSSGVINAIENFENFDLDIYQATEKSGKSCTQGIQATTQEIDRIMTKGSAEEKQNMFQKLGNENPDVEYFDFMFYVADIFTMGVQYGTRTQMCSQIQSAAWQQDPVGSLGKYAVTKGVSADEYDAASLRNVTVDIDKNIRQWTWQYCTEFGWFQTPSADPTRSQELKQANWLDYCRRIFDDSLPGPDVKHANAVFGGLEITGENIFFLNAIEDPWQYAGMLEIHDPVKQKDMRAERINCTDCGHCVDLKASSPSDPPELTKARNDVYAQILEWLGDHDEQEFLQY